MAGFGAVLDTCVLYPMPVADTLLLAAQRDLYVLRWTDDLFAELERAMRKRGRAADQARRRVETMRSVFIESRVLGYHRIARDLQAAMPDPDDGHVLAAAIRSGAERIITFNLRHFPPALLEEHSVQARHPDQFLCDLVDLHPAEMLALLRHQAEQQKRPPVTFEQLLVKLEADTPEFVAQVRQVLEIERFQQRDSGELGEEAPPPNVVQMAARPRRRSRKSPDARHP